MPLIRFFEILEDLIRKGGELQGILCEGTIDCVVDRINNEHGVYAKAAWALYMSRLNPFFDGHKRTCFTVAAIILRMNGHWIGRDEQDEFFEALHKISDINIECDVERIENWLKTKSAKWWKQYQRPLSDFE